MTETTALEVLPVEELAEVTGGDGPPTPNATRAWNGREYRPLDSNGNWLIEY